MRTVALAGLLAVLVARVVLTYHVFNDTFDESTHIAAGLEILQRGTYTLEAQHPPLARLVLALLPYHFANLRLNGHMDLWGQGPWTQGHLPFYWKSLGLARAGNLVFAVILFCFVYRWSSLLFGSGAGVMACLLAVCCPNLIAHAGLATNDMAAAATVLMSAYFFWRWSRHPGLTYCLAAAAAFGAATLSKFSALLFLPPLALLYFLTRRWTDPPGSQIGGKQAGSSASKGRVSTAAGRALAFMLLFLLILWAGYFFQTGTIAGPRDRLSSPVPMVPDSRLFHLVSTTPLTAPSFARGVAEVLIHNAQGHQSYLLGKVSRYGWWYYFPVAVAVKSTLPMLLLAGMGVAVAGRKSLCPLLAIVVVLGLSMPANINIGVRHVLGIYPFLAILGAGVFSSERRALLAVALGLAGWHTWESIATHPDYLGYFNCVARGREERFLVDSNLDWGQDLARLGHYMRDHHIEFVYLDYFGRSSPDKMGVTTRRLDGRRPEPGWMAVSVSNLMTRDDLRWLRVRNPSARVGKSIWLYQLGGGGGPLPH